ncbi:MAG: phosphoadenosine phosphosulfate reductase family protein, partial [Methanomicrobiales archaeon]
MRVNTEALRKVEASAILFDQEVAGLNRDLVANVSYSMEKYSRATLLVVTKAIRKVPLLFADTGLEFLETYANIEEASLHYVLELIRSY